LLTRFNTNSSTIFLDVSSSDIGNVKNIKKLNIILSPSFYWVKKVSLPVKTVRDAIKLLPSVFEDMLPVGIYSYSAYKEGEYFYVFAYEDKKIIDTFQKLGISLSNISNVYFAQSELKNLQGAIKVSDTQSVYLKDGIVVLVPCCWIEENGKLDVDSLHLSKYKIKLKQYGHIVDNRVFYKVIAICTVLILLVLTEYFITSHKKEQIIVQKEEIFSKYNLKSTMFQNKSLLKKYKTIHSKQTNIREYLSYMLSLKLKGKEKISKIDLSEKLLVVEFIELKAITMKSIEISLKEKKLKFKLSKTSSSGLHVEISL
jgi:hypothetical protein